MQDLIGNTPLLKINNMGVKEGVNLFAKLEFMNPGGSCKDRIGLYMIKDAEEKGLLKEGSTIIEATAGNTGIGVAFAAINRGYKVIFVVPTKFSEEKLALMRAFGAEIVSTPKEEGMLGATKKAQELLDTIPNSMSFRQFENPANPMAHYLTTGKEIYEDLDGQIDYLVAGAGTGGTYTGITKYLKERIPTVKGILADPYGSTMGGGEHHMYDIEGIGNDFIPNTMDISLVDEVIKVKDDASYEMARTLAKREGLIVGSSSGATMIAALEICSKIDRGNVVAVLFDRGDRYFSKGIYRQ